MAFRTARLSRDVDILWGLRGFNVVASGARIEIMSLVFKLCGWIPFFGERWLDDAPL